MDGKIEYPDSSQVYTTNFVRNSKAIGVLWAVFTICFAIIDIVVFVQPQWIGDTIESEGTGYFGLWKHCSVVREGAELVCHGRLDDLNGILTPAFRASTVFVGLSVVIVMLCICCMLLFCFFHSTTVFHICGWMELFSGTCLLVGVLVFPAGWDAPKVKEVCGPSARDYRLGECGIRWAYILAAIAVVDAFILSALAFVLATRHIKVHSEPIYTTNSIYKGEINPGYMGEVPSVAGSRRSMNLQPVLLLPPGGVPQGVMEADRYSEFSQRTAQSKPTAYRPEYGMSQHNFQL